MLSPKSTTRSSHFPDAFKDTPGTLPAKNVHLTTIESSTPVICCARTLPEWTCGWTYWLGQSNVCRGKEIWNSYLYWPKTSKWSTKRENYKLLTLEDVLPELSKAKVFSVCVLKSGYLHCELDHSSSLLTTFATPFGRYRWLRLPFGREYAASLMMWSFGVDLMKNIMYESVPSSSAVWIRVLPWTKRSVIFASTKFLSWAMC